MKVGELTAGDAVSSGVSRDGVVLAVFALGLALRIWIASTTIYLWDEEGD